MKNKNLLASIVSSEYLTSRGLSCALCKNYRPVFKCSRCKKTYYCGKHHQKMDWRSHKFSCGYRDSQEKNSLGLKKFEKIKDKSEFQKNRGTFFLLPSYLLVNLIILDKQQFQTIDKLSIRVVQNLKLVGFCVIDYIVESNVLDNISNEITSLYNNPGIFEFGTLSNKDERSSIDTVKDESIRNDRVTWLEENDCWLYPNIFYAVKIMDGIAMSCSSSDILRNFRIKGRSKLMLSCFPGNGSHYRRHIDSPANNGMRLTFEFHVNKNYKAEENGGHTRILWDKQNMFDIAPKYGRLVVFWSDRTVHEVLPCYSEQFSITIWYFDFMGKTVAKDTCVETSSGESIACSYV